VPETKGVSLAEIKVLVAQGPAARRSGKFLAAVLDEHDDSSVPIDVSMMQVDAAGFDQVVELGGTFDFN